MLIALDGIDGAGKTTVARRLCQVLRSRCPEQKVSYLRRSAPELTDVRAQRHANGLRQLIWPDPLVEPETDDGGTQYYLYLLAAWASLVDRYRIAPTRSSELIVSDGWYTRNIAKARVRAGLPRQWLQTLFEHVGRPDLLVFLDVDPATAWRRRESFKPTEMGRWDGFEGDSRVAYCSYQRAVNSELLNLATGPECMVIAPPVYATVNDIVEEILEELERCSLIGPATLVAGRADQMPMIADQEGGGDK